MRKTLAEITTRDNPLDASSLRVRNMYLRERAKGTLAKGAWNNVKTRIEWDRLDYGDNDERTLVRLRVVADDSAQLDDLLGDTFATDVNPDIPAARLERERKAEIERINREGVYGVIGEYRVSAGEPWERADSCWGFVGDDWKNGYETDCMHETLRALERAQADVCPHCHRPRKS